MAIRHVRLDLLVPQGTEVPTHVGSTPTLQSIYRKRAKECMCIAPLLVDDDLYGLWESHMTAVCESDPADPLEQAFKHTVQWKMDDLGIAASNVPLTGVPDRAVADATLWLHRILPQQEEVCRLTGQPCWPILTLIQSLPCAAAAGPFPCETKTVPWAPGAAEDRRRILSNVLHHANP